MNFLLFLKTLPKKIALKLLDAVDDCHGAFEDGYVVDRETSKCGLDQGNSASQG